MPYVMLLSTYLFPKYTLQAYYHLLHGSTAWNMRVAASIKRSMWLAMLLVLS